MGAFLSFAKYVVDCSRSDIYERHPDEDCQLESKTGHPNWKTSGMRVIGKGYAVTAHEKLIIQALIVSRKFLSSSVVLILFRNR